MKLKIDKIKALAYKWKLMGWSFPGTGRGFFRGNHGLNCQKGHDATITKMRRQDNKKKRLNYKQKLKNIIKNND